MSEPQGIEWVQDALWDDWGDWCDICGGYCDQVSRDSLPPSCPPVNLGELE
jgi:hypothetical protein